MKYIYIYIDIMYFQTGKHLWTYHGMVEDPMCASFKAFLLCHQMPLSIPGVGVQQELFQAQPSFWTIENGDVYWCCLMFPINLGRTNIYIYIFMLQLHLYMFLYADMKIPLIHFRDYERWWYLQVCLKMDKFGWCCVPSFNCDFAEVSRPSPGMMW